MTAPDLKIYAVQRPIRDAPVGRFYEGLTNRLQAEPTIEAQLRQELRDYAVELRQLAYSLPNGVGEHDLLRMSGRMRAAADQVIPK